jgi:starch-binding outer membrane protein, SusD/RagB family
MTRLRKNIICLIIISVMPFSGCNEWLDLLPPNGLIRDEFWKTKEDVKAVLMGAYETFSKIDGLMFRYGEIRADMVRGGLNMPENDRQILEGFIYPENPLCNWRQLYQVINYCNEVIYYAPIVQSLDKTFSTFLLQGYLAEAYFLRSLSYFYLVRVFNEVPLVLEPSLSEEVNFYIKKSDAETVLSAITADLERMRGFAPADGLITLEENKGRASRAAFDALLADIALWNFNYEDCLRHIERIEIGGRYQLMPRILWFELFYPGNSLESIFEFQFDSRKSQNNGLYDLTQYFSHNYRASQKAIELFAREYARELYRGENISIRRYEEGEYIIWKYVGRLGDGRTPRSGTDLRSCNWIIYRYADVILMKAEALSQLGRFEEALTEINRIRLRAEVPLLDLAPLAVVFEDAILNERALEFAFEGKRWFDLLRMGRRNNYSRKGQLIEILVANVPSTQRRILSLKLTDPNGWYLPVFNDELKRNKALVQNPYYQ